VTYHLSLLLAAAARMIATKTTFGAPPAWVRAARDRPGRLHGRWRDVVLVGRRSPIVT
jgi:hypothetical protein